MVATFRNELTISSRILERLERGELSQIQVDEFQDFLTQVDRAFLQHHIITHNAYTHWFQEGRASDTQLRHFIRQFSANANMAL